MSTLTRRRFFTISAAALALAGRPASAAPMHQWRGIAMGAEATITLAHPEPRPIIAAAVAEIARVDAIFSLYRGNSALSRLNGSGRLANPPFELLECPSVCNTVHAATGGFFDPTIQPLWATYAEHHSQGRSPTLDAIGRALARTGWAKVRYDPSAITCSAPDMALTLNGIAQGYIADRVASLLEARWLNDILVNTGEYRALGGHPNGRDWQIRLVQGDRQLDTTASLRSAALATSAPLGTTFDAAGKTGHILNPKTGHPASANWQLVTVKAPKAALADALSTAICLMGRPEIEEALTRLPTAELINLAA